jgi:hypothetical protein
MGTESKKKKEYCQQEFVADTLIPWRNLLLVFLIKKHRVAAQVKTHKNIQGIIPKI